MFWKKLYSRLDCMQLSTCMCRRSGRFYSQRIRTSVTMSEGIKYLTQVEAAAIDQQLFSEYQFSVDQLMELAGLSCATAVARELSQTPSNTESPSQRRVLVVCGPGNNGGDGLVCARHLCLFGMDVAVFYAERRKQVPLYERLLHQCRSAGVAIITEPEQFVVAGCSMLVDALFGFSFRPPVRPQFSAAMSLLTRSARLHNVPVCSIDVPSGWHVEHGPITQPDSSDEDTVQPQMLVSLTAPKLCARKFSGVHYLGGRFVPPDIERKYSLNLPRYPHTDCVVKLY